MKIALQFLEGNTHATPISPVDARARLQEAFLRLDLSMVLLGWDLDAQVIEACASECSLHGADLYLWQPLLTAHSRCRLDPFWRVIGLDNHPVTGDGDLPGFIFHCPNRRQVRENVLQDLDTALSCGCFQGVFFDRIRFPSPAADPSTRLACFCPVCRELAREEDLDLEHVRKDLSNRLKEREGRKNILRGLFSTPAEHDPGDSSRSLGKLLAFRQRSISSFIAGLSGAAAARGLKVGLDCFSPTMAPMVGQDLAALQNQCDWIKLMTYVRAYGPASILFETLALADWLISHRDENQTTFVDMLSGATGWSLPVSRPGIQDVRTSTSILATELQRGQAIAGGHVWAGIELVEIRGVSNLDMDQVRRDCEVILSGASEGVVLSWDLLYMPLEYLDLVNEVFNHSSSSSLENSASQ